ncbi:unnamed protein product [Prunus armeniaca]|uniref:Uncharacterized protein n=1 Tax=Prunus armeniaca TaxID=36596 RepID=A0A6J5TM91_PRUAR|nr:unnamed protein product [Prunus armeniaca]
MPGPNSSLAKSPEAPYRTCLHNIFQGSCTNKWRPQKIFSRHPCRTAKLCNKNGGAQNMDTIMTSLLQNSLTKAQAKPRRIKETRIHKRKTCRTATLYNSSTSPWHELVHSGPQNLPPEPSF